MVNCLLSLSIDFRSVDMAIDEIGMNHSLPDPVTLIQEKTKKAIVAGSEGRPDRPTNLPHVPFRRQMSINAKINGLTSSKPPDFSHQTVTAFKMRTKRILQKKPQLRVSAEADYFLHFWDIPEVSKEPKIKLGKVCRCFTQRLREVATVVTKLGRGRKRKVVEVTFVSTGNGEVDEIEAPFAEPVVPGLDFPASADKQKGLPEAVSGDEDDEAHDNDGPEYIETDDPAAPEHDFFDPGQANNDDYDLLGEMRKQGLFFLSSIVQAAVCTVKP